MTDNIEAPAATKPIPTRVRGRPRVVEKLDLRDEVRDPPRTTTAMAHGRSRKRKGNIDKFNIPKEIIPQGWVYQWCRCSIYGQADVANMVAMQENGWTPVPAERHAGLYMPPESRGDIVRDGLILCERPRELSDEARTEDKQRADQLVQAQKEQLGLAMPRGFDTRHRGVTPRVNQYYEPGIPQGGHQVAVD